MVSKVSPGIEAGWWLDTGGWTRHETVYVRAELAGVVCPNFPCLRAGVSIGQIPGDVDHCDPPAALEQEQGF
jgi:hypothetical protein